MTGADLIDPDGKDLKKQFSILQKFSALQNHLEHNFKRDLVVYLICDLLTILFTKCISGYILIIVTLFLSWNVFHMKYHLGKMPLTADVYKQMKSFSRRHYFRQILFWNVFNFIIVFNEWPNLHALNMISIAWGLYHLWEMVMFYRKISNMLETEIIKTPTRYNLLYQTLWQHIFYPNGNTISQYPE